LVKTMGEARKNLSSMAQDFSLRSKWQKGAVN
jgi:hypothetical protein